jgi:hypothetical protein
MRVVRMCHPGAANTPLALDSRLTGQRQVTAAARK